MGRKSSIRRLPVEVRQEIDRLLGAEHTLDEILAHLRAMGAPAPSRSALGRYATDFREVSAHLREARAVAAGFARELGVVQEGEAHQVLVQMLQTMMMRHGMSRLRDADAEDDAKEMMFLAKTIRDLMASTKDREAIRAAEEKKARERLVRELERAEAEEKGSGKDGLSAETIGKLKAEFLGMGG